ncbi:hypothetical protein BAZMOX_258626_0 [methanotrophic endosymbiont of Bathymodiolus azoricus (Menez Gwen)]|nr:hypothetical protein BAZMOX_258626_0 [methanotrophic endosymbiont of Bathymodiolus azoricus (Menez Gwen)]
MNERLVNCTPLLVLKIVGVLTSRAFSSAPIFRPILKERFSSKYRLIIGVINMSTKRKSHSARFKARVALEAYKGDKTAAELISTHKISSCQISTWKKCLVAGAVQLFKSGRAKAVDEETLTSPLYEEIGRLKVELDWLKKSERILLSLRDNG